MNCKKCGAPINNPTAKIDELIKKYNNYIIMHPIILPETYFECACGHRNYYVR